jgi:ferric-dicitrate binding protein FerR (iron transport regulator)
MGEKMQIEKLIEKFYLGSITDNEMVFLLNYLKEKEPNHEILSHYQVMWEKAGEFNEKIDSKSIYDKIVREVSYYGVGLKSATESPDRLGFIGYFRTFMRYAAVFVFAFGLFWLTQSILFKKPATPQIIAKEQITRVEVPYGSKSRVILPDGSVVTLNSGSNLMYSSSGFDSLNRSVYLTGEGFFDVIKDNERPFYVNTSEIKLKVLGTTFNIKAYPDENIEEATLVTGKVEIFFRSDKYEKGTSVLLKPDQIAIFDKSEKSFHSINKSNRTNNEIVPVKLKTVNSHTSLRTEQIISWKENKLIFDNEPFSNLVTRIERWYDVKIIVKYPELNAARFTGKFDKETFEQVLRALVLVTPFDYEIKRNIITISKR